MTDRLRLRDTIAFARFDEVAIVLDIAADRYWQLSGAAAAALSWASSDQSDAIAPAGVERLEALGMLEHTEGQISCTRRVSLPPSRDLIDADPDVPALRPLLAVEVILVAATAVIALKVAPLHRLLAGIARRRARARRPRLDAGAASIARAYARYRPLLPVAPVCLADSLGLLAMLARRGYYPDLVFGVAAYPFAAHCWVQQDDLVLNDVLDHAHLFVPIHVV